MGRITSTSLGFLVGAVGSLVWVGGCLFRRQVAAEIAELKSEAAAAPAKTFHYADLEGQPEPVQRYFKYALADGQEVIRYARLTQEGEIRMNPRLPWLRVQAEQHFTTARPGFIWVARASLTPVLWFDGRDMYFRGEGHMLIKLATAVPVVDAQGPEMNVSALLRFLSEAPWFPTALLPSDYLCWEAIDDRSALAIISDGGTTASGVFEFDAEGRIVKFSSEERYREVGGRYERAKWSTYGWDYHDLVPGVKIPVQADAEWNLPEGDLPYFRGRVTDIQYMI
ncbi:MAG: hypothetical protein M0Z94_02705 [Dehalococcoidales bacterium]|nr:hypothetical protein [Dehalococcoidales bacterium]